MHIAAQDLRSLPAMLFSSYSTRLGRIASCFAASTSRHISGRARRKAASIPPNAKSSASLTAEIRKRFDIWEKEQQLEADRVKKPEEIYALDSIAAEIYFRSNVNKFTSLAAKRREAEEEIERKTEIPASDNEKVVLPLRAQEILPSASTVDVPEENSESLDLRAEEDSLFTDRGFFVQGDRFTDEYIAGTVSDFPEEEMTSGTTLRFGPEDALEEIEFQQPGQSSNIEEYQKTSAVDIEDGEWLRHYGTVDPSIAVSDKSCSGCGAKLHCRDSSLPGFLPVELFVKLGSRKNLTDTLCRRCYLIKEHNFLVNVNVCEVDYRSMMQHLRLKQEALILLVADMTDLPFSLYKDLPDIIGDRKPMIVVGNKVDLLPPDQVSGYLRNFREVLRKATIEAGFADRFNILHTALASAKTGFGIEDLITNIHLKWSSGIYSLRNDIYLVGCTNAGKSTLFNTFLQSDLCKVRAIDLVERATTSVWPGTTISLLKFPVMNPSPHKLELRRRRLLANKAWDLKEKRLRRKMCEETGDPKYATLQATVGNSYKDIEEQLQPISILKLRKADQLGVMIEAEEKKPRWSLDDEIFTKGHWCYDTPGTVNSQQVINLFTLDELIAVVPRKMIMPRTFIVYPGDSLLIGGVARIDLLDISFHRRIAAYLTVFASDMLPVNVLKTTEVDTFLERYLGTATLVVPAGGRKRLSSFPKLEGKEMEVKALGNTRGAADIVLSSIGWVCVAANGGTIRIKGFTPGGRGLTVREEPILPLYVNLRGARIPGTAGYKVKPVEFPVSEKKGMRLKESAKRRRRRSLVD